MSRRQAPPDESAKAPVKRPDVADSELVAEVIDSGLLRKVELVRQRYIGKQAEADDPRSVFDWGL